MREVSILRVSPESWRKDFAEAAHKGVFGERLGENYEVDIALIGLIEGEAAAYSTASEVGDGILHLHYGGAFDFARGSPEVIALYRLAIFEYLKLSSFLRTYVHNRNYNYLNLALRAGFIVTGIRTFKGDTLLELTLDKEKS